MKTIIYSTMLLLSFILLGACNDEWNDEQYKKYVSFVRSGYVNTYLNYNSENGTVHYTIPVEVSGSTVNDRNVTVTIGVDPDTLAAMNIARYYRREDLFFRQLDAKHYQFQTMQTTIPAGKDVGYINVEFKIGDLDLVEKYILPLNITATSEYTPSPNKWYRRSLMRIVPFNDYSGSYSATGGTIKEEGNDTPITVDTREMRVVDTNTVFFYAGLTEEEARDRAKYKVKALFTPTNESGGTITLLADSAAIAFTHQPDACFYTVESYMDALQPYLEISTITLHLKYSYSDVSSPEYPVKYNFDGTYLMERRRNTQIPEEDQQFIFE